MAPRTSQRVPKSVKVAATLLSLVLLIGILSWAKVVLVPLALAVLLTFILSPVVTRIDRWGLRRIPAVLVVVAGAGLLLAAMTWLVGSQLNSLANDLPNYRDNIRGKVATIREGGKGVFEKVRATVAEATRQPAARKSVERDPETDVPSEVPEPISVRVVPEEGPEKAFSTALASVLAVSPALGGLATVGIAMVLVIFMLVNLEDLRNRLVSFTAHDNLAVTTKALDEAGQRISRYLFIQLIINGTFGVAVAIGLLWIGVPYALLWGLCAGVFRYIPYVGPWVAALLPLTVSLVTSPDWTQVLLVFVMFLVLELLSNNVMEPLLYGQGIGVSAFALLVSATFWTWVWGPIGLILATPLTVCLAVLGKYVPSLAFFDKLLGEQPALHPSHAFLQRILARDENEAAKIVRQFRADHGVEKTYDQVLLPALALARQERTRGTMEPEDEASVLKLTRCVLDDNCLKQETLVANGNTALENGKVQLIGETDSATNGSNQLPNFGSELQRKILNVPVIDVVGCAAHQEAEELTLNMLDQLVSPVGLQFEILSTRTLPSEVVDRVGRVRPAVVVIATLPPGGLTQARYLCKILHKRFPETRIVVGCWMYRGNLDRVIVKLRSAGADYITTTIEGARDHVVSLTRQASASQASASDEARQSVHGESTAAKELQGSDCQPFSALPSESRPLQTVKPK